MARTDLPRRGTLARGWRRSSTTVRRRIVPSDAFALLSAALLACGLAAASVRVPDWVPISALALVLFLGGFLLTLRSMVLIGIVVAGLLVAVTVGRSDSARPVTPGGAIVVLAMLVLVLVVARSRSRLGVPGTRGESMLVDLRDRLRAQGELPPLPSGWGAEVVLRSAYGATFSGDFLVASQSPDERTLEVALVDVSGKGVDAGTRALLLSGAFGGLLGAMDREDFLPAANQYLLRQRWREGFATAVHLVIDLESGDYLVTSAGHPPAAQFFAGSGRWRTTDSTTGPLLGVVEDGEYVGEKGRLDRGDAMLLYTDGVVEVPGRDLSVGIDRLLGEAERLVTRGFRHGARKLVDAVASGESDDRALVLIWRE
ncbi:MAG: PP2C family protein-serine/threonine phosphatase [Motilibacteraceae bacterium]